MWWQLSMLGPASDSIGIIVECLRYSVWQPSHSPWLARQSLKPGDWKWWNLHYNCALDLKHHISSHARIGYMKYYKTPLRESEMNPRKVNRWFGICPDRSQILVASKTSFDILVTLQNTAGVILKQWCQIKPLSNINTCLGLRGLPLIGDWRSVNKMSATDAVPDARKGACATRNFRLPRHSNWLP